MLEEDRRPRVLIADDDPVLLTLFRRGLQDGLSYDIRTVSDGDAVLREVETFSPDVVLLDLLMPKRNGFEVCRVLKSSPSTSHVPICVMSAMSEVDTRAAALAAGADDFLGKPAHMAELRLRVHVLAKRKLNADYLHATAVEMERWRREHRDLVSLLVHDLRGPLAALASATAFIERSDNATDREFLITVLRDGIKRLSAIIDNVATKQQMEAVQALPLKDEIDLNEVVRGVSLELQRLLALREQHLELDVADMPLRLSGDVVLLHQMVSNAFLNAIEYAPAGSAITVRTTAVGSDVVLSVEDNGASIPPDLAQSILSATAHGRLKRSGVRIGRAQALIVLDMAATLHGGGVRFEHPPGGGLRLVVTLPRLVVTDVAAGAVGNPADRRLAAALVMEMVIGEARCEVRTIEIGESSALVEPHVGLEPGMILPARVIDFPTALCSAEVTRRDATGVELTWVAKSSAFSKRLAAVLKCRLNPTQGAPVGSSGS
jgi:two-component system, sensor histidine kinase and response regulator